MSDSSQTVEYSFAQNVKLLRHKVSKYAILGLLISLIAMSVASILAAYLLNGEISLSSFIEAQRSNPALWILDLTPFLFSFWGQYVSDVLAYEAGVMVVDQTSQFQIREKVLESQVVYESMHDSLTALPNRVLFFDRLTQAIANIQDETFKIAICVLNITNFKEVNETLSYYEADRLLQQTATRLKTAIAPPNTVARFGGNEFAVLLPQVKTEDDAVSMAHQIQKCFESQFALENITLHLRAGIGIVLFPDHGRTVETLIQRAELALVIAKERKADFIIYSPEYDKEGTSKRIVLADLQNAIANNQLKLFYQPQVDLKTNEIQFVEGLIRWIHPTQGLVPPDEFIPYAERTGLIRKLSQWVLEESMRQCKEWRKAGFQIGISINLSPVDLLNVNLVADIKKVLETYQADPSWLVIEITENALMVDQELGQRILTELFQLGIQVAIDDFGTGYSSLAKLSKLPANILKVDKSFVMNMLKSKGDEVIVRSVIDLAHNLNLIAIAEGVAEQGIFDKLVKMNCDIAQGFYISKPIPAKELEEFLSDLTFKPSDKNPERPPA